MDFCVLKIAQFNIKINFNRSIWIFFRQVLTFEITRFYKAFIVKKGAKKVDFIIDFKDKEKIDFNNKKMGYYVHFFDKLSNTHIVTDYSISITQFQTILYYVLSYLLYNNGYIMLHGSGAIIKNKAYIFLAPSSGGKSTIIRLLYKTFPIIGDDSIILKIIDDHLYCFPTPFKEKQWWIKKINNRYPVARLLFLNKSKRIKLETIKGNFNLIRLLKNQILFGMENQTLYQMNIQAFLKKLIKLNCSYSFSFPKVKTLSKIILDFF